MEQFGEVPMPGFSDAFRFVWNWFDLNPLAAPALALWLVTIAIAYCLTHRTDRGGVKQ